MEEENKMETKQSGIKAPRGTELTTKGWVQEASKRLERVLTTDPGMGVVRHVDAGYDKAIQTAKEKGIQIPALEE